MGTLIYFEEDPKHYGAIRFVSGYRAKRWYWKEKISYSLSSSSAYPFMDNYIKDKVCERIKRDYPNAKIYCTDGPSFDKNFALHKFWVIARYTGSYQEEFYNGHDQQYKATYTKDISDVRIMLSESSAKETLRTIQQTTRDRVFIRALYLNLVNELLTPVFMITCTSKGNGETKFFRKLDGNRVRMVGTSGAATKFTYEEVLERFAYLQQHNKNFLYAVMPVFKDNVSARNIESYMKENKVSRMVVMDLQLKHLNR